VPDQLVHIRIKRQATPDLQPYWEDFDVRWRSGMNVISALMEIAANPGDAFRDGHTPNCVRVQLPGRGVWFLCHADQRKIRNGVLTPVANAWGDGTA